MQLRRHSLAEAVINVMIGWGVALLSQIIIFPLLGVEATLDQNILITTYFTMISVVRSYSVRRMWNSFDERRFKNGG